MKQYNDPHYLIRKIKPYLKVNANTKIISLPEGIEVHPKGVKYMELLVEKYNFEIQIVIDVPKYDLIYLSRSVGICGNKIDFLNCKCFGISPGTKVNQIGEGKISFENHVDKFSQPYEYAGAIILQQIKYFAFKMPKELMPHSDKEFYFLYSKDKYHLYRTIYTNKNKLDYIKKFTPKYKIQK